MIGEGSKVKMHYTLTVAGEFADSSEGKDPLEYTQGQKMIIPGLESQLEGLTTGTEKKVIVMPEDGYGQVNPKLIVEIPTANLGTEITPQLGMVLQMTTPDGQNVPGVITEVKDDTVVINFNHPLAGQVLQFDIKIVEVN